MLKYLMSITLTVMSSLYTTASDYTHYNTDSLISVLDEIIQDKEIYEQKKQDNINRHLLRFRNAVSDMAQYTECGALFEYYRKFKLDSALYYAQKKVEIAHQIGIRDSICLAMMNEADGMKGLGKFHEGIEVLRAIPKTDFVKHSPYYYYLCHSIILSLSKEAISTAETRNLRMKLHLYRDTIAMVNNRNSAGYIVNQGERLKSNGKYKEALTLLLDYQAKHPEEVSNNAMFWCALADTYHIFGDTEAEKYYLTKGAIIDKRNCVKTYTSLQSLALLLNNEGDIKHAYKYISCAMEDIISCNARSRLFQVAEYMPIITAAYTQQSRQEYFHVLIFFIIISLLVIILAFVMAVLYKRNVKLRETRHTLDIKNGQLTSLNDSLESLNHQLSDSNKIKEEYIAQLFNICSGYIDDMEKYRVSLVRKLKAGQEAEMRKALDKSIATSSLKDFFSRFDIIFLDLFPTFIESFNKLLAPEAKITPKEGELLTPELRIYALVRLGINDSTKIASFLHYSSQTVYNYRLKIRNKSLVPKDKFVEEVQKLR